MPESRLASNQRYLPFGLVLLALAISTPVPAAGDDGPLTPPEGFLTFDQLPAEASRPKDRLADYEAALAKMTAVDRAEDPRWRSRFPGFTDLVIDLSSLTEPEDAVAAAHSLKETVGSRELYEDVGVVLLKVARQARFGQELERAHHHLRAAEYVFALADREKKAGYSATGERDFIHRAMVCLEEILVSDSQDRWHDAAERLTAQLQVTPTGATADWAQRILDDPATYVGEPYLDLVAGYHVGGDIHPPVKIFAPPPRFTQLARTARLQGVIIVQVVIDRHGTVAALKLLKGLPMGLGEEALRTMSTWLFQPATLDGQAVSVYYILTVNFRL